MAKVTGSGFAGRDEPIDSTGSKPGRVLKPSVPSYRTVLSATCLLLAVPLITLGTLLVLRTASPNAWTILCGGFSLLVMALLVRMQRPAPSSASRATRNQGNVPTE